MKFNKISSSMLRMSVQPNVSKINFNRKIPKKKKTKEIPEIINEEEECATVVQGTIV